MSDKIISGLAQKGLPFISSYYDSSYFFCLKFWIFMNFFMRPLLLLIFFHFEAVCIFLSFCRNPDQNFFSDQNFFFEPKCFWTKIFFGTKIFFRTNIFFGPKFFSDQHFFFGPTFFFGSKSFGSKKI